MRPSTPSIALTTLCLLASFAACAPSSANLQRPTGAAGLDTAGQPALEAHVLQAIREGASHKGWTVTAEEPGVVTATVNSGGHNATVKIEYTAGGWVIQHDSSSPGLKYDPNYQGREIIHHRYNMWVRHLNKAIQVSLRRVRQRAAVTGSASEATAAPAPPPAPVPPAPPAAAVTEPQASPAASTQPPAQPTPAPPAQPTPAPPAQ